MAVINFVGGEKGGVGKSLVARLLAQYMVDREIPFLGFDADKSHGALLRFYADFASPLAVDSYESLDAMVEAAVQDPSRQILVDLAAQTQQPLIKWIDEAGLLEVAKELNLKLTYWHVMDSGRDSVDLLKKLLDRFGTNLNYVLVLNQLRGDDFGILDKSGVKERALALDAKLVSLTRLYEPVMAKIDAHSISFWSAVNNNDKEGTGLGLLDRQRIKTWIKKTYEEFDKLSIRVSA
jgi:hypothetical protein